MPSCSTIFTVLNFTKFVRPRKNVIINTYCTKIRQSCSRWY